MSLPAPRAPFAYVRGKRTDADRSNRALGAQVLLGAVLEWDRVQGAAGNFTERGFLSM